MTAIPLTVSGVMAIGYFKPELLVKPIQLVKEIPVPQPTQESEQPSETSTTTAAKLSTTLDDLPSQTLDPTQNITYTTVNNDYSTHPVTETTVEVGLSDLDKKLLLYINDENELATLSTGASGQVLQSRGSGTIPNWIDLGNISVDWASPGAIGGTSPNSATFTSASLGGGAFAVNTSGRLDLSYSGDSGYLSSSGGVIFINNTNNIGTGIGIYSNAAGDALGNMINVKVDNPLYNQAAFYMNYDGLSNAVEIVSNSSDTSSNALAVTGNNINDSTVGIIGYELGRGTVKITHNRPGSGTDSSASGLSIDLKGVGTRAQGVYVDSTETGGTLGNLLRLRNESVDKFVVNYQGNLAMAGNLVQGANGTNTTFTKYGNTSGDEFFIGSNAALRFQRSAGNSETFRTQIAGDVNGRWVGTSDGRLRWGNGTDATDVTLYRTGIGVLALDGGLTINNSNANYDFVVKGASDNNLFFVDTSSNNVGIGTSGPVFKFDVNGTGRFAGASIGASSFGTGAVNVLAIASSTAPSTSITDGIQLFAVDQAGSHELRVRDEAGNVTTLSPHNFSAVPDGLSEPMAWSYYSERNGLAVSADMTKALRLVEGLTGVELVYVKDLKTGEYLENGAPVQVTSEKEADWQAELAQFVSKESLASVATWDDSVWSFLNDVVFKARATFERTAVFLADVQILGKLKLGSDTAGKVTIPKGASSLTVTFSSPYADVPQVYLTPVGEVFENFTISQISDTAFTISLEHPAEKEVAFNWLAVLSTGGESAVEAHFPSVNASPNPDSTPIPEVAGVATESGELEISEEASPAAEASGSATPSSTE